MRAAPPPARATRRCRRRGSSGAAAGARPARGTRSWLPSGPAGKHPRASRRGVRRSESAIRRCPHPCPWFPSNHSGDRVAERVPRAGQERLGSLVADCEPAGDLAHRKPVDVLPLEHVAVVAGQRVERSLDDALQLFAPGARVRPVGIRGRERLEDRPRVRLVLEQHDARAATTGLPEVVGKHVAADLAEPGVQRRLAAIGLQPLERIAERLLDHVLRRLTVPVQARHREAVEPREEIVEQLPKRGLVAGADPASQCLVGVDDDEVSHVPFDAPGAGILRPAKDYGASRVQAITRPRPQQAQAKEHPMSALKRTVALAIAALLPAAAVAAGDGYTRDFPLAACEFTPWGGNAYFRLKPNRQLYLSNVRCVQENECDELEEVWITVLPETRLVEFDQGGQHFAVRTRVVQEFETADGEVDEISYNFFANCSNMNDVYYFGEEVFDGEGNPEDDAWIAGKDGARPGII